MQPGKPPRRRAGTRTFVALALALACALAPTSAWAIASRPGDGTLSPRLAELAKPSVRSAPPVKQAEELSLATEGPGSLLREGGRIVVDVRFDHGAAAGVDELRAAGAKILNVVPRYQRVTVAAKPAELRRLSGVPRVVGATPVLSPIVYGSGDPGPVTATATPCFGAATSEGDSQLRAAEARETFGVDGSGVTVGILSDSFNQDSKAPTDAAKDVASGDLPGPGNPCERKDEVEVLDDSETKGEDEGRAMAQIVHDLAPGAKLAFATAFTPDVFSFADNVRKLAEPVVSGGAAADVIADDVSYFEEPFFQEGPVGVAVREVTEGGVSYFSAAGNNNLIGGNRDIASWEAPEFRDGGSCPAGLPPYAEHCMDFNPQAPVDLTFGVKVSPGATLRADLQWAQPWNGVTTDLDAYLLNSANNLLAVSEDFNAASTQMPFEFLPWTNTTGAAQTVRIAINRCDSTCGGPSGGDTGSPRLKLALLQNGGGVTETEYEESSGGDVVGPTIFGHNGAEDAMSLGAIDYEATASPERYSSLGPVTHYFGPVEGATAAPPLSPKKVLSKPDLVATDCGATTFFASLEGGIWRFCGTSAAAPHAAGVAALMIEKDGSAEPEDIRLALRRSTSAIGTFGPCAIGAGLVDAVGAIEELLSPTGEEPAACTAPAPNPWKVLEQGEIEPVQIPVAPDIETPAEVPPPVVKPRPRTFFLLHPARVIRTSHLKAKAVFRFGASENGATFVCRVDGEPFRECRRRFVGRFGVGPHAMRVIARDAAGNSDRTPAVYRFRVKRVG